MRNYAALGKEGGLSMHKEIQARNTWCVGEQVREDSEEGEKNRVRGWRMEKECYLRHGK